MTDSLVHKPYQYKDKWLIWPQTVLEGIEDVDCDDTVNGYCTVGKTIQECIDTCKNQKCSIGYYAKFNNNKTVCVPLHTDDKQEIDEIYRLRDKNKLYPELNNIDISTFINTDIYAFPPEKANVIFYGDILSMIHILSGESVVVGKDKEVIFLEKTTFGNNIQFVSPVTYRKTEKITELRYGHQFCIIIPNTTLLASGFNGSMIWRSTFPTKELTLSLLPIDKKLGDIVTYSDNFLLQYTGSSFIYVDNNILRLKYIEYEVAKQDPNFIFKAESKMTGYYCDNNECKPVPIRDIKANGEEGRYKGVTVSRDKNCWGACKYLIVGTNDTYPYEIFGEVSKNKSHFILFALSVLLIIICILVIRRFH